MPSSPVVVLLAAAAVLLPAAIIQGRSSRLARKPKASPLRPFPAGFAKGAYRTAPGMRPPVLQHTVPARFPAETTEPAAATVEVLAVIDEDGDVTARVLAAPEPREPFEREALAAIRKYAFEPGAIEGSAVPVVVTLLVDFRSPGAQQPVVRIVGGTGDPPADVATSLKALAEPSGDRILRPLPLSKVYPDVSAEDLRKISGRVEMLAILKADGTVGEVEITTPLAPAVDEAAVDAFRRWVFEPPLRNGRAVPVLVSAFVSFNEGSP